jgi:hypothetical protein
MGHEKTCTGPTVAKVKKGDWFKVGTNDTYYIALKDETVRGYVHCKAPFVSVATKHKFNTNVNDITVVPSPEEGTK